ncbi:MAG: hypothetical protein ACTHKG_10095 [Nocardioides sp.]
MTAPAGSLYVFRVEGHLDEHWADWLGDLTLRHHPDGTSSLRGRITDQAELHGVLAKLRDLGVSLIAVTPAAPPHTATEKE